MLQELVRACNLRHSPPDFLRGHHILSFVFISYSSKLKSSTEAVRIPGVYCESPPVILILQLSPHRNISMGEWEKLPCTSTLRRNVCHQSNVPGTLYDFFLAHHGIRHAASRHIVSISWPIKRAMARYGVSWYFMEFNVQSCCAMVFRGSFCCSTLCSSSWHCRGNAPWRCHGIGK